MSPLVDPNLKSQVAKLLGDDELFDCTLLQTLWSGYGQCFRFRSKNHPGYRVAKVVTPTRPSSHPKGWSDQHSHQRKLTSYLVEQSFYQQYARITKADVPKLIACSHTQKGFITILEDLNGRGYRNRHQQLSVNQSISVLQWLARFHADFYTCSAEKLWPQGAYWHLATRSAELQAMEEGPLKDAATKIDTTLQQAIAKTLIHGDAKVANFCFDDYAGKVAAVDFQYVGAGAGIVDIAYFMGSALSQKDQANHYEYCLDIYFDALAAALNKHDCDSERIINEWRALYPFACADFLRFLKGWSPSHWKINPHLLSQSRHALSLLKA